MPMPSAYGVLSSWVKVNPAQTGVYRVRYSPELLSKLVPVRCLQLCPCLR